MSIINKLVDFFTVGGENPKERTPKITNKILLKELVEHFETQLEEESVGKRMLYPMAFNVLMHADDYADRKDALKLVLPEVVATFYDVIKRHQTEYPNFTPPAKYWFFQFSSCELNEIEIIASEPTQIEKGKITTLSTLFTFDFQAGNTRSETNVHFSIKPQNSDPSGNKNINEEAFKKINMLAEGAFYFDFDKDLRNETGGIQPTFRSLAELRCSDNLFIGINGNGNVYDMRDNLITITNKRDERQGANIVKLDTGAIIGGHVQIKYLPTENRFQIAAFGMTKLNGRGKPLDLSAGGNIQWYDLPNKSQIFMNDTIALEFKIN
ncbi:hypothetical protein FACS189428_7180 [Clostridia bacterium]|nr:hypothetical protein FACS189428_7180 [Clostridia bacterium]